MSETKTTEKEVAKKKVAKKKAAKKFYGPNVYKRNDDGLLGNVEYVFDEDGSINWRGMIKDEFLYPNKGWFDARNKPTPSSSEGLEDKQLLIMLGGIKEIAKMRGYSSVDFDVNNISDGYVMAKCTVKWDGNYESSHTVYSDVANATLANTDAFCAKFLETIACNRAFVRCVRNYLGIHIVGADEIDKSKGAIQEVDTSSVASTITSPTDLLEKTLRDKHGVDCFDDCKDVLRALWKSGKYKNEDTKSWGSFRIFRPKKLGSLLPHLANDKKDSRP